MKYVYDCHVALIFPAPLYFNGERYSSDTITYRSIFSTLSYFKKSEIITFVKHTPAIGRYFVDIENCHVHSLPYPENRIQWHITKALPIIANLFYNLCRLKKLNVNTVVLFDMYFPNPIAYYICKFLKLKVILRMTGRYDLWISESLKYDNFLVKFAGKFYSFFIKYLESSIAKKYKVITDGSFNFTSYVKDSHIEFCVESPLPACSIPALNPYIAKPKSNTVKILCICRMHPGKGIHMLLDAMSILKQNNFSFHLDIGGPLYGQKFGDYEYRIRQQIDKLNLAEYVTIHGWLAEGETLEKIWSQADLFVIPYLTDADGVPRVIFESMSRGIPVVSTNVGGISNVLMDDDGILTGDLIPETFAASVINLFNNKDLLLSISNKLHADSYNYTAETASSHLAKIIFTNCSRYTAHE